MSVELSDHEKAANGPLVGDLSLVEAERTRSAAVAHPGYDPSLNGAEIADAQVYPAGSAAYWFRKRLDTQPGAKLTRIPDVALWVAVAVVQPRRSSTALAVPIMRRMAERAAAPERPRGEPLRRHARAPRRTAPRPRT